MGIRYDVELLYGFCNDRTKDDKEMRKTWLLKV